jgi:excinuclease UvrABC nuclease subunit
LLRDLLLQLQEAVATQPNQGLSDHDQDVVWLDQGRVLTLHLRQGRLEALSEYAAPGGADAALAFLKEHYRHNCPPELITAPLPGAAALAAGLSGSNGYAVTVTTAASGRPAELLKMAQINHAYRLTGRLPEKTKGQATL